MTRGAVGLGALAAVILGCAVWARPAIRGARNEFMAQTRPLATVGLYIAPAEEGQSHFYDFYKACGYNYLEFCETGFATRPDLLPEYYTGMAEAIATARGKGLQVWVLLLAGMRQWKGPEPRGDAGTFSALDRTTLNERLAYLRNAVRALKHADGFVFFAGDPGGDPEGRSTVRDCMAFASEVKAIVAQESPQASFAVNLWAVAEWAGFPSPFTVEFWQKQVALSKLIAQEDGFLGPECGVVFSMDNYYRSLALRAYADNGIKPELYPTASVISALRRRGVKPIYGWPYFLVDEVDDGFVTPNNVATRGQSQAETRYIRAIVDRGRRLGLDGLVANAAYIYSEPLNIWAFARMCRDDRLTPERALDEYARIVAAPETSSALAQVFRFIENHSSWHHSLPQAYRLPDLACELTGPKAAMDTLLTVVPREKTDLTLPEPPRTYITRLQRRLEAIQAGNIGGPNPHMPPPPARGDRR
jgi:hypothetical protein